MTDLLSLSGVYRIEEDPGIEEAENFTWPFDYKVEVTRDEGDTSLYYIANDVTSGGETLETFAHVRDNGDGTYDLTYDEYGDGNLVSLDGIDEELLATHLNHLVNMDVAVKVSDLPEGGSVTETETEETLEESDLSDKVLDYIDSTYDKAINDNRSGMTEDRDGEADKAYICAHCGKKIVNGKGHAEDCWTQEMLKEDSDQIDDKIVKKFADKWASKVDRFDPDDFLNEIESDISKNGGEKVKGLASHYAQAVIRDLKKKGKHHYDPEKDRDEYHLEEDFSDSVVDRFKANEVDKMSTEEVDMNDVIDDLLNYKDAADQLTFRDGIALVNELLLKQETLTESKKDKPARKRKRA